MKLLDRLATQVSEATNGYANAKPSGGISRRVLLRLVAGAGATGATAAFGKEAAASQTGYVKYEAYAARCRNVPNLSGNVVTTLSCYDPYYGYSYDGPYSGEYACSGCSGNDCKSDWWGFFSQSQQEYCYVHGSALSAYPADWCAC